MKCPHCKKETSTLYAHGTNFYKYDDKTGDKDNIYVTDLEMRWCEDCDWTSGPIEV